MKKKSLLIIGIFIMAVTMLNISLISTNNKSLNSISLIARQAFAHDYEYPHYHMAATYEHSCQVYDPRTQLYGTGVEVDCMNSTEMGICTSMNCTMVYGG